MFLLNFHCAAFTPYVKFLALFGRPALSTRIFLKKIKESVKRDNVKIANERDNILTQLHSVAEEQNGAPFDNGAKKAACTFHSFCAHGFNGYGFDSFFQVQQNRNLVQIWSFQLIYSILFTASIVAQSV